MRDVTSGIAADGWETETASVEVRQVTIRVGIESGDLRGSDHRALQAAVDYVAGLGGGTVHIGPGRYLMRNALMLRDHVRILGVPGQTVLAAADGARSRLACDGDCNERQITLADPRGFQVGDGGAGADQASGGGVPGPPGPRHAQGGG